MTTLLLIDDDEKVLSFLCKTLTKEGYDLVTATDGAEALKTIRNRQVRLVITDIFMPGMDGMELIRTLKQDHAEVPIIAISGGGAGGHKDYYLSAADAFGADRVLAKPFTPTELRDAVRALLV
ncbi:response regulator transcription factor [Magnetospira sp. QH-2]|uniref:response regulator transcription factor n=1 Tax=Magnetospira sp. (strain QH-2) TaxID=1288970 RepID=UPI0003E81827|nr:response regulator [Magnetospira sp. QH-2]CCQ72477.1 Response regulator receiver protein [Magnetospira sp. QH-2]